MTSRAIGAGPLAVGAAFVGFFLAMLGGATIARAQIDMRQMSGIPRPVDDLPAGSVAVRVIRGDVSNVVTSHPVEMHSSSTTQTVSTDAEGRAQFDHIPPGTPVRFSTDVDGEHLESQEFPMPAQAGVRLLLVATGGSAGGLAASAAPAAEAVAGSVVIAGESRIVVEPSDDTVTVYYILDIVNDGSAPVRPEKPFTFTLPAAASETTVVQGSSPLASSRGRDVTVAGPFPPGTTALQVAAEYPVGAGTIEINQAFPASMPQVVVIAKKAGDLKMTSPQFLRVEETVVEGATVVLGMGSRLEAGNPLALNIAGLPHHSSAPRTLALLLAAVIVALGVWASTRPHPLSDDRGAEHRRLVARRETLFQDLVRLEQDRRRGRVDEARYAGRREELVQALEHVYGALEEDDAGPEPAKRQGVAA